MGSRSTNVPYWPEKLTTPDTTLTQPCLALVETSIIRQVYVADNGVGPCLMTFDDGLFVDWAPKLTFERTQRGVA